MTNRRFAAEDGYSLIEIVVVLVIVAVMATFATITENVEPLSPAYVPLSGGSTLEEP